MAKFYDELNESHQKFIEEQKMFFVATAPNQGRVNLSPKGMETLSILDKNTIAYLDIIGSGNESAAHITENGRMTFMFCSFEKAPLILRLYGKGELIRRSNPKWDELYKNFTPKTGERQIIVLHIESLQTSCGFSVPFYEFKAHRNQLTEWCENKGSERLVKYQLEKNNQSIDGAEHGLMNDLK